MKPSSSIKQLVEKFYLSTTPDDLPMEALGWILSVLGHESDKNPRRFQIYSIISFFKAKLPMRSLDT